MSARGPKHSSEPPRGRKPSGVHPAAPGPTRRRGDRWPADAEVEILSPVRCIGWALDVSKGGIQVSLDEWLPAGTVCELRITTHTGRTMYKRARVVWMRRAEARCVSGLEIFRTLAPPTGEQD